MARRKIAHGTLQVRIRGLNRCELGFPYRLGFDEDLPQPDGTIMKRQLFQN